eukprot:810805_1
MASQKNQPLDWCNYFKYTLTPVYSMASLSLIVPLVSFIYARWKQNLKIHRVFYWLQTVFFASIVMFYALRAAFYRLRCDDEHISELFRLIARLTWGVESYWFVMLLFFIFKDTMFRLSHFTIRSFVVFFTLCNTMVFIDDRMRSGPVPVLPAILILGTHLLLIILMDSFFIYKVMTVHKACRNSVNNPETLMKLITKTTLLSLISTSQTVLTMAVFVVNLFDISLPY